MKNPKELLRIFSHFSVFGIGFLTNARGAQHLDLNLTGGRDSVNRKRFLK